MTHAPCAYNPSRLHRAWGQPGLRGTIRGEAEDFQVDEMLGFEPQGAGEHVWVRVRKAGLNSRDVLARIARLCSVRERDVGVSGLKDRNALTSQWFSVAVPAGREPDWLQLNEPGLAVLQVSRHGRKLRRGTHRGNRFRLLIRGLEGDPQDLSERLSRASEGVPNYFGEQRFGRGGANLPKAWQMFQGQGRKPSRYQRGLYLSAVRSMLFNRLLSARVESGTWNRPLPGDVMMLDGSRSIFAAQQLDGELERRCRERDIHPTGPLWGQGRPSSRDLALAAEEELERQCGAWCRGLEAAGLKQERRALRLVPVDLRWQLGQDGLNLQFSLPAGAYATTVLRECVEYAG